MEHSDDSAIRGLRVLIAEDSPILAFDMEQYLAERGCLIVGLFGTLREALTAASRLTFDAAILGCRLQKESVAELAAQITARGIPCLIATARKEHELPNSMRSQRLLKKPFNNEDLAAALASLVTH